MNRVIKSEVIIYHDETKGAGALQLRGHVLFFVPIKTAIKETGGLFGEQITWIEPWESLFKRIEEIRNNYNVNHKFHFSNISGRKWVKANCAEKLLVEMGVKYLRQQGRGFCKLGIIFYESPTPHQIGDYGGEDKNEKELRFGETILRMLLKGAVHYLYDDNHKIKILNIFTDGQPHHRKLSEFRILEKLLGNVRGYVEISDRAELIHLDSNHRKHDKDSEEYRHANMLQLTDMLLGAVIHSCLRDAEIRKVNPKIGDDVADKKGIIAYPVREMLNKRKRGRGFKNSSHYKAFTISRAYIKNYGWEFESIMTKEIESPNERQLYIFDIKELGK